MKVDSFSLAFTAMAAPRWSYKKEIEFALKLGFKGVDLRCSQNQGEVTLDTSLEIIARIRQDFISAGGAGLIWVEATAVVTEGKTHPRQPYLNENSLENLKELAGAKRDNWFDYLGKKQNPFLVLQQTHSGRYSKTFRASKPAIFQRSM